MSEESPTQDELYAAYLDRVYNEDIGPVTVRPADWTTSPEALDILTGQGCGRLPSLDRRARPNQLVGGTTS